MAFPLRQGGDGDPPEWEPPDYAKPVEDDDNSGEAWTPPSYAKAVTEETPKKSLFKRAYDTITDKNLFIPKPKEIKKEALPNPSSEERVKAANELKDPGQGSYDPNKHAQISSFSDNVIGAASKFLDEHPSIGRTARRVLDVTSDTDQTKPTGEALMEVPGTKTLAEKVKNIGERTGNYWGGVAGSVGSDIISMLGSGFDPRTAGLGPNTPKLASEIKQPTAAEEPLPIRRNVRTDLTKRALKDTTPQQDAVAIALTKDQVSRTPKNISDETGIPQPSVRRTMSELEKKSTTDQERLPISAKIFADEVPVRQADKLKNDPYEFAGDSIRQPEAVQRDFGYNERDSLGPEYEKAVAAPKNEQKLLEGGNQEQPPIQQPVKPVAEKILEQPTEPPNKSFNPFAKKSSEGGTTISSLGAGQGEQLLRIAKETGEDIRTAAKRLGFDPTEEELQDLYSKIGKIGLAGQANEKPSPDRSPNLDPNLFKIGTDSPGSVGRSTEDQLYDIARNRHNMGKDLPGGVRPKIEEPISQSVEGWKPPEYAKVIEPKEPFDLFKEATKDKGPVKAGLPYLDEDGEVIGHTTDIEGSTGFKPVEASGEQKPFQSGQFSKYEEGQKFADEVSGKVGGKDPVSEIDDKSKSSKREDGVSIKKGSDFRNDGNYEVKFPNGKETKIFYDRASQNWYEDKKTNKPHTSHYSDLWGFTKEELLDKLKKRDMPEELKFSPNDITELQGGLGGIKPSSRVLEPNSGPYGKALDKLFNAMGKIKENRVQQDIINKTERARRFAKSAGVKEEGVIGAAKSLAAHRGEFEKVNLDKLQMTQPQVDSLMTAVKRANITEGEKLRGYTALFKLFNGEGVPQRNELALLDQVFGNHFAEKITELHGGIGAMGLNIAKAANTMKSLENSISLAAPLRHGAGLLTHKEFYPAFVDMFKFFAKKEYYDAAMQSITEHPMYLKAREAGLFLSNPNSIMNSEEEFLNSYVGKLPKWTGIPQTVGASQRAYSGFLNKLRFDVNNSMYKKAESLGYKMFDEIKDKQGNISYSPTKEASAIAKFINNATGRGDLPFGLNKMTNELNVLLWSPRMITSRINMFAKPSLYMDLPVGMRREGLKTLLGIASMSTIINTLGYLGGAKIGTNIFSTDFMKSRLSGNKVIDPNAGLQQFVVAAARFLAGKTDSKTPTNRLEIAGNFLANKESPAASLAHSILTAKQINQPDPNNPLSFGSYTNKYNQTTTIPAEVIKRFTPIFIEDLHQLMTDEPDFSKDIGLDVIMGAASLTGMAQDYPERKTGGLKLRKPGTKLSVK